MRRFLFAGLNVACARAISAAFLYCACRASFGSHDVALDQCIKRLQGGCAGANLVGQRRHTQIDAFAPVRSLWRFSG